ncbi:hypothetical protein UA45_11540, partial [Morganella morganii]
MLSLNERNVLLSNVWSNFSQARLNLSRALISGRSENEIDSLLNSAIKNLKDVEGDWEKFNSTPNLHGQIRTNLEDSYNTYYTTIIELIQLIRNRDLNTAILQDTQTSQDAYLKHYDTYSHKNNDIIAQTIKEDDKADRQSIWILITVLCITLLIVIGIWSGLKRILITPLNNVLDNIRHIAGGDLTRTIDMTGCDEVNKLSDTLRYMQGELAGTVSNVR